MTRFKVGDRVRTRQGGQIYMVAEVDVPGWTVFPPSTYVVRLHAPRSAHPDPLVKGDAYLERLP